MTEAEEVVRAPVRPLLRAAARHAGGVGATGSTESIRRHGRAASRDFIAGMTDGFALSEHARLFPK